MAQNNRYKTWKRKKVGQEYFANNWYVNYRDLYRDRGIVVFLFCDGLRLSSLQARGAVCEDVDSLRFTRATAVPDEFKLQYPKLSSVNANSKLRRRRPSVFLPSLWNELPLDIRSHPSVDSFKTSLKTRLFTEVYGSTQSVSNSWRLVSVFPSPCVWSSLYQIFEAFLWGFEARVNSVKQWKVCKRKIILDS